MSDEKLRHLKERLAEVGLPLRRRYGVPDAAVIFGRDRKTIRNWCAQAEIESERIGKLYKISAQEIDDLLRLGGWR